MSVNFFCHYRNCTHIQRVVFYVPKGENFCPPEKNKSEVDEDQETEDEISSSPEDLMAVSSEAKQEGAQYIQDATQQLQQLTEKSPRDRIRDYLADNQLLQEYYQKSREHLSQELNSLKERAKGTKIAQYVEKLADEYLRDFDGQMLNLFKTLDLKNNAAVISRILQNNHSVHFILPGEMLDGELYTFRSSHEAAITIIEKNTIAINTDFNFGSYEFFKNMFIHESLHACVQGFRGHESDTFQQLAEGVTTMLATDIAGFNEKKLGGIYRYTTAIATTLYKADPKALLEWYAGALNDDEYQAVLRQKMNPEFVDKVFNIGENNKKLRNEAFSKTIETVNKFSDRMKYLTKNEENQIYQQCIQYVLAYKEVGLELKLKKIGLIELFYKLSDLRRKIYEKGEAFYKELQGLQK